MSTDMKDKRNAWLFLATLGLMVSTSEAGVPPANFEFLIDTTQDTTGPHQYFNFSDAAGTRTENYAGDNGSGNAVGTIFGGPAPFLHTKVNLTTINAGVQQADAYVQLDYYFQASGPAGNVPLNFVGNLIFPNPLPPTTGGTAIEASVNMIDSLQNVTNLAYVNNSATPTIKLPASGVPGGNLNQTLTVTANSVYHFRLAVQTHAVNETASYEVLLDPTLTIDPEFAATHPDYTLSFSTGFGPMPALQIQTVGTKAVITWPSSAQGYVLQVTSDLTATNSWTAVTNVPVVVGSVYAVTNAISDQGKFYRLAY